MYKNYIFDLYGTLVDIRTDEESPYLWEKMSQIYGAYGAIYEPEELRRAFRRLEHEQAEKFLAENAEIDLRKVFECLFKDRGVKCGKKRAKMTAITFRALSRSRLQLYDGVRELLEELREKGRGVYLLSNAQADFTRPEVAMLGLEEYFDGIFLSSEQGVKKPSRVFFERLLQTYGLNPWESVMIGNDELADIEGANAAGMDSLYIHTAISPQKTGRALATYRVMDGDFRKIRDLIVK